MKIGDRVIVTDGSSDGHTGTIIKIRSTTSIRIKRDADSVEVDVSPFFVIIPPKNRMTDNKYGMKQPEMRHKINFGDNPPK